MARGAREIRDRLQDALRATGDEWVSDYGLWVLGYGLWVMGYGLWVVVI